MVSTRQNKKTKLWRYELYVSSFFNPDTVSEYIYTSSEEAVDAGYLALNS